MKPLKQVLYVLGSSYCGSTLLNSLLDTQPGVRGLSEAHHWFTDSGAGWCSRCKNRLWDCSTMFKQFRGNPDFYDHMFQHYGDTHTLVNASKFPEFCFKVMPPPSPDTRVGIIVLSKMPHEFAWSWKSHHDGEHNSDGIKSYEVGLALDRWQWAFEPLLNYLRAGTDWQREAAQWLFVPAVAPYHILMMSYRDLASDPVGQVRRVCETFDLEFDEVAAGDPWREPSTTCMIGGNQAIYAQQTRLTGFFRDDESNQYLKGKYAGKLGQVFLDEQWRADKEFKEICAQYYKIGYGYRIDGLAKSLGYPDGTAGLLADLAK